MSSIFFYSRFHLYGYCLLDIHTSVSPFFLFFPFFLSFTAFPPEVLLLRMWLQLFSPIYIYIYIYVYVIPYMLYHICTRAQEFLAENLCRYSWPFHRVCPQSTVSERMTSRSAFPYASRAPAVTHLSTDTVPYWLSAGHLPHTECCQSVCKIFYALVKHFTSKSHYFVPQGHYFAHWCWQRPCLLTVTGAQMRILHACVKKNCIFISGIFRKFNICKIKSGSITVSSKMSS